MVAGDGIPNFAYKSGWLDLFCRDIVVDPRPQIMEMGTIQTEF